MSTEENDLSPGWVKTASEIARALAILEAQRAALGPRTSWTASAVANRLARRKSTLRRYCKKVGKTWQAHTVNLERFLDGDAPKLRPGKSR